MQGLEMSVQGSSQGGFRPALRWVPGPAQGCVARGGACWPSCIRRAASRRQQPILTAVMPAFVPKTPTPAGQQPAPQTSRHRLRAAPCQRCHQPAGPSSTHCIVSRHSNARFTRARTCFQRPCLHHHPPRSMPAAGAAAANCHLASLKCGPPERGRCRQAGHAITAPPRRAASQTHQPPSSLGTSLRSCACLTSSATHRGQGRRPRPPGPTPWWAGALHSAL